MLPYPLTAPTIVPWTKYFWMNGYTQMIGTAAKMMQAAFRTSGFVIATVGNTLGLEAFTRGNNQVIQFELQRAQRDILFNVVQRIGVGIPTANCIEQGDGCHDGFGQRHNDLCQNGEVGSTVQAGGLDQAFGDRTLEVVLHDQQVVRCKAQRQNQAPDGIQHVQLVHQQVVRDRTGGKVHREHDHKGEHLAAMEFRAGQRIGGTNRKKHTDCCKHNGNQGGDPQGLHNGGVMEHLIVSIQIDAGITHWQQNHAVCNNVSIIGQRLCQNMDERQDTGQRCCTNDHEAEDVDDQVNHAGLGPRLFALFNSRCCGSGHIYLPSLQQAILAKFFGDTVGCDNQNHADHGLEQAKRCGFAEFVALEPFVNQNRDGGGEFGCLGIGQSNDTFEAAAHQFAKLHDQHDHDGGADARQRNMQALLPAIGTIDLGSLVQFRIDVRDGG